jgi:hypothetical protein
MPTPHARRQLIDEQETDTELMNVLVGEYVDPFDDARYFVVRAALARPPVGRP